MGSDDRLDENFGLSADDETMVADATRWSQEEGVKHHRKGIMVLPTYSHKMTVVDMLCREGWLKLQSDNLQAPGGDTLYVRTANDMMSGIQINRLWIHPLCPPSVDRALIPCVKV